MLLTVKLPAPLHRQVLHEFVVVAELNRLDPAVLPLQLREDRLAAAAAKRVFHHQVDHVMDAQVLVERGIPLQHAVLAGLYYRSAQFAAAHRTLPYLVQTFPTYAVVQMVILAVGPLVQHVEVVEADQTINGVLVQLQALLLRVDQAGGASNCFRALLVGGDARVQLAVKPVVLLNDAGEVLSATGKSYADDVLGQLLKVVLEVYSAGHA